MSSRPLLDPDESLKVMFLVSLFFPGVSIWDWGALTEKVADFVRSYSGTRQAQILEDSLCKIFINFVMPGNGGDFLLPAVDVDAVVSTFA